MDPKEHAWPVLYKKDTRGKMLLWKIWVVESTIYMRSGTSTGKLRETHDTIKQGKNLGRSNETSPHDQAILEAQSRFDKQIDRGYSRERTKAERGLVESSVDGGFFPMLAHSYDKSSSKIVFPCFVQPKLDGLRATVHAGSFYSRSRKPFPAVSHLRRELERLGLTETPFDGELYNHRHRDRFEDIVSAVKRGETSELTETIEYHIYDANFPGSFADRHSTIKSIFREKIKNSKILRLVPTQVVSNEKEMRLAYESFMDDGYEGAMIRNKEGVYEFRRSYNLQKLKEFEDSEFKIIGINEGRGQLAGHAATFICEIKDEHGRRTFDAKLRGKNVTPFLKKCFTDKSLWYGKSLTVEFQGYTTKNRLPRFPRGVRIREEE